MGFTKTRNGLIVEVIDDIIDLSSFKFQEWNFVWKWIRLVIHFAKRYRFGLTLSQVADGPLLCSM